MFGVYVTWHVAMLPLAAESEHVAALKLPEPVDVLQLTVPVGAGLLALLTIAVQVVAVSTATGFGAQLTAAPLPRLTASANAPLLALCVVSPP